MLTEALLAQWGQTAFTVVELGSVGLAFFETVRALGPATSHELDGKHENATAVRTEFRRILPVAAMLTLLQLCGILLAFLSPQFRPLLPIAIMYLFFALALPFLWTAGQAHAAKCRIPVAPAWATSRKVLITSLLAVGGIILSLALVILNDVRPGAAVENLSGGTENDAALVVMALWLLFNAPWMEELIFRHYLIPRLARFPWFKNTMVLLVLSTAVCAAVFAIGHAGHMVPAWPKLTQTFLWGLMLGWSRIYFGTFSAIMLHLVFNLSAPLAAPFLQT